MWGYVDRGHLTGLVEVCGWHSRAITLLTARSKKERALADGTI